MGNCQQESLQLQSKQTTIDLLKVLNFAQETMQTLSNYSEQLQTHLDIKLTHREMS